MDIKFYIPKDESVPTQLRLRIDGDIDVYYDRSPSGGWKFWLFKFQNVTREMAEAIVEEIWQRMENQSYDHGVSWRECGVREVYEDRYSIEITIDYRVRDAG